MMSTVRSNSPANNCELCDSDGGTVLFRAERFRVVAVTGDEALRYLGFCRVIWNQHVREMSDLAHEEQMQFMNAVFRLESALRLSLSPDKINLASLGNITPHLHWHVIPRFRDDATFPSPIWAAGGDITRNTSEASSATLGDNANWQQAVIHAFDY